MLGSHRNGFVCLMRSVAFLVFFVVTTGSALAQGIQMLPPVDPTQATAAGCSDGSTSPNRVLTWDGSTAIKCSDKLKADSNGNITANAVTVTGSTTVPACGGGAGAGSIYFNASQKLFMGCDGTSWTALGENWVDVSLSDTNPFDINCEYKVNLYNGYMDPILGLQGVPATLTSKTEWAHFYFIWPSMMCVVNDSNIASLVCMEYANKKELVEYDNAGPGWTRNVDASGDFVIYSVKKKCPYEPPTN